MDFSIWGTLKTVVYRTEILSRDYLLERTHDACAAIRADEEMIQQATNAVIKRVELYIDNYVGHFENYL